MLRVIWQAVQSILKSHEEDGYQMRIDGGGAGRKRLVCALTPHTRKRKRADDAESPKKARVTNTMRHLECSATLSVRLNDSDEWQVTNLCCEHTHAPHRSRLSLRWYRPLSSSVAKDRSVHNIRVSSILSQLRAENISLTSQEVRNLISFDSRNPVDQNGADIGDGGSTVGDGGCGRTESTTAQLFRHLDDDSDVSYIASFTAVDDNQREIPSQPKFQFKIPAVSTEPRGVATVLPPPTIGLFSTTAIQQFSSGTSAFCVADFVADPTSCSISADALANQSRDDDDSPALRLDAVAWMSTEAIIAARRYLLVIQADSTFKTNKLRYSLVYFVSQDGDGRNCVVMRALIRSESNASYNFLWSIALPYFYGQHLRRTSLVLTDGDSRLYEMADVAINGGLYGCGFTRRRLCFWHRVIHVFNGDYPQCLRHNDGGVGETVLAVVIYICYKAPTEKLFDEWWAALVTWVDGKCESGLPVLNHSVLQDLLRNWFRDRKYIASAYTPCRSLGSKATARTESENLCLKKHDVNDCSQCH